MDCEGGTCSQSLAPGGRASLLQRPNGGINFQPQRRERGHRNSLHEDWHQADVQDPRARLLGSRPGLRTGTPEKTKPCAATTFN